MVGSFELARCRGGVDTQHAVELFGRPPLLASLVVQPLWTHRPPRLYAPPVRRSRSVCFEDQVGVNLNHTTPGSPTRLPGLSPVRSVFSGTGVNWLYERDSSQDDTRRGGGPADAGARLRTRIARAKKKSFHERGEGHERTSPGARARTPRREGAARLRPQTAAGWALAPRSLQPPRFCTLRTSIK